VYDFEPPLIQPSIVIGPVCVDEAGLEVLSVWAITLAEAIVTTEHKKHRDKYLNDTAPPSIAVGVFLFRHTQSARGLP